MKPFGLFLEGNYGACPDCEGSGALNLEFAADGSLYGADPCLWCNGTGRRFIYTKEAP